MKTGIRGRGIIFARGRGSKNKMIAKMELKFNAVFFALYPGFHEMGKSSV